MEKCDGDGIFLEMRACIQNEYWFLLQNWPFKIFCVNSSYNAYLQL